MKSELYFYSNPQSEACQIKMHVTVTITNQKRPKSHFVSTQERKIEGKINNLVLFIYQCAHILWNLIWTQHSSCKSSSSLPISTFLGCPKFLGSSAALSFKVDQANVESCA